MPNITAPKIPEGDKVDFDVSNMKFKLHHFLYSLQSVGMEYYSVFLTTLNLVNLHIGY